MSKAYNRLAGGFSPLASTILRMGRFLRCSKLPYNHDDLQRGLPNASPRPFHPVGRMTSVETRGSLSLPEVRAFTASHPITVSVWRLCHLLTSASSRQALPIGALSGSRLGSGGDDQGFRIGP